MSKFIDKRSDELLADYLSLRSIVKDQLAAGIFDCARSARLGDMRDELVCRGVPLIPLADLELPTQH